MARSQTRSASTTSEFFSGAPVLEIPEASGGSGYQGFSKKRRDIKVAGEIVVHSAHMVCVIIIPAVKLLRPSGMRLLKPVGEGIDEFILETGSPI